MGLRIVSTEKNEFEKRRSTALRKRLLEVEAKRWSASRVGNVEELHAEFLKKIKDIRETLTSPAQASSKAAALESLIKQPENMGIHTQTPVNPKTLLDLL